MGLEREVTGFRKLFENTIEKLLQAPAAVGPQPYYYPPPPMQHSYYQPPAPMATGTAYPGYQQAQYPTSGLPVVPTSTSISDPVTLFPAAPTYTGFPPLAANPAAISQQQTFTPSIGTSTPSGQLQSIQFTSSPSTASPAPTATTNAPATVSSTSQ